MVKTEIPGAGGLRQSDAYRCSGRRRVEGADPDL